MYLNEGVKIFDIAKLNEMAVMNEKIQSFPSSVKGHQSEHNCIQENPTKAKIFQCCQIS